MELFYKIRNKYTDDFKMKKNMKKSDLYRVKHDMYGNPRVVVHFLNLISNKESDKLTLDAKYSLAYLRALKLGGKKYRGKDFGGGFVFQSYNDDELVKNINELTKIN